MFSQMQMKMRIRYLISAPFPCITHCGNEMLIGVGLLTWDLLQLCVSGITKQSVLQVGQDSAGIKWLEGQSQRRGNSISWRSSQQAPQWAGLAWRQSAHLLQAPAVLMCKHATYVWTALVFIHCAGVNPCKSNVGATGSTAIRHLWGGCCVPAEPTGCQCSGVHRVGPRGPASTALLSAGLQ